MHYTVPIPGKIELTQDEVNSFTPLNSAIKPEQNSWPRSLRTLKSKQQQVDQRKIPEFEAPLNQQWFSLFIFSMPSVWNQCSLNREVSIVVQRVIEPGEAWMKGRERKLLKLRESRGNPSTFSLFPLFFHLPLTSKCHGADVSGSDGGWRWILQEPKLKG